jgi:hypothetical protein
MGWSTYFAFIFAAVNTLTVTYFLAIENYPILKEIFPTFELYLVTIITLGIPTLILIGYLHFKRTPSYRSEAAINYESNPYGRRIFVNSELNVKLNLELMELILKISNGGKLSENDLSRINSIKDELKQFTNERTLENTKDLEFMKENTDM